MTKARTGRRRQRRSSGRQEAGGGRRGEEPGGKNGKREAGEGMREVVIGALVLRNVPGRNGPDHLVRSVSELGIARMAQAKRAGPPRARHLVNQGSEDVSGETGRTTSRTASQSSECRGCLRRNGPDHLARGSSEPRFRRMSQAKRPIPDNSETRVVRMSRAKRPGPPDFVEDVSTPLSLGRN